MSKLNKDIEIRSSLWLTYDKDNPSNGFLTCKAYWKSFDRVLITFIRLVDENYIGFTYSTFPRTCKKNFKFSDRELRWKITNYEDILRILKEYKCYV